VVVTAIITAVEVAENACEDGAGEQRGARMHTHDKLADNHVIKFRPIKNLKQRITSEV
jgi:hypothetical protein